MVQRHAARFVLNKFDRYTSVTEMINILGWPTLESRRNTMRTEMMYKIMNNLVDVPTDTILLPSSLQLRGHSNNYPVERMLMSILQGIKLWNSLPQHLIDSPDLSTFKEGLNNLTTLYITCTYHTYQTSQPGIRPGHEKASLPSPCNCEAYHHSFMMGLMHIHLF